MRPDAFRVRPSLKVERSSEINRFAGNCQMRAYDQVLPVVRQRDGMMLATNQDESDLEKLPGSNEEGVAA